MEKGKSVSAVFVQGHPDTDLHANLKEVMMKIADAKAKGFECLKFENADTDGDTAFFEDYKARGLMDEMENHYQMTKPVFGEYKTYPKWKEDTDIPIPDEDFDEVMDEIVEEIVDDIVDKVEKEEEEDEDCSEVIELLGALGINVEETEGGTLLSMVDKVEEEDELEAGELCMDCNLDKCVCGIVDGNDKNKARITIKTKEWFKENIEGKIGTLMFPSDWREIRVCDLDPKVYCKMRQTYEFSGRIKMFCHTGLNKTAEPNTQFKHQHPHFVEDGWEGAYQLDGMLVGDYVYGEVVVVC